MNKQKTLISPCGLEHLCRKWQWFANGTPKEYEKLFVMAENQNNEYNLRDIAMFIHVHSDDAWTLEKVYIKIMEDQLDFYKTIALDLWNNQK